MIGPPCGHLPAKDGCRICHLFEHHDGYRNLWLSPRTVAPPQPPKNPVKKIALDCIHLDERVRFGIEPYVARGYRECNAGHGLKCGCESNQRCNAIECQDYSLNPDYEVPP